MMRIAMSESEIEIRRAEERDLSTLGRLGALMVRLHYGFDRDRFMKPGANVEEGYAWFLGTQLAESDAFVAVAERGEEIVGYVYAGLESESWKELRGPAGFIHDLVVDERSRGNGVGTKLAEAAAAWLESRGAPRVMLWTAQKNEAAQRLFERLGFRRTMLEMTRERRDAERKATSR
jgi:ribosomal protein S18 acetylase RimI-like enzyme